MKIEIPKVLAAVDLAEYAPALKGQTFFVWVNPTADVDIRHAELSKLLSRKNSKVSDELLEWYAQLWSQGSPETHWTLAELKELDTKDPTLLSWMISATWEKRREQAAYKKKI